MNIKLVLSLATLACINSAMAMAPKEAGAAKVEIINFFATPIAQWKTMAEFEKVKPLIDKFAKARTEGKVFADLYEKFKDDYNKLQAEREKGKAAIKKLEGLLEGAETKYKESVKAYQEGSKARLEAAEKFKETINTLQASGKASKKELDDFHAAVTELEKEIVAMRDVALNGLKLIHMHYGILFNALGKKYETVEGEMTDLEKAITELISKLAPKAPIARLTKTPASKAKTA